MWNVRCIYHYRRYEFDGYDRNELRQKEDLDFIISFENQESLQDFIKNNTIEKWYGNVFEINKTIENGKEKYDTWYENTNTNHKELK